nr:GEVED domain-containing protein [Bacteroidota bacterium]
PVYSVVQNHQSPIEAQLYAGTELGIYFKKGTDDWISYNTGLPNVKIGEIEMYYAADPEQSLLRAGTFGRGLWESPVFFEPKPMAYVSAIGKHTNVSPVFPGRTDQVIIKAEIIMDGNLYPLAATSFTFNTTGTTSPSTDIANAKLFSSGGNSSFSTANPFGSVVAAPNGDITFNGNQTLSPGINNFWLTYDVTNLASPGNLLDAQFLSVTITDAQTPSISNPLGNRSIQTEYCTAGTNDKYEHITNVTMANINKNSGWGANGYSDYTASLIRIETGLAEEVSVSTGDVYEADELLIWVDWNIDGDFEDADEEVYASGPIGQDIYTTSISVPPTATLGLTRIRFRLHDTENGPNNTPCGLSEWGDVEDYSLLVIGSDPCTYLNYVAVDAQNVSGDYVGLTDEGVIIEVDDFDDDNSDPQDIGFAFRYHCQDFTQFILNTNGFIKLGNIPTSEDNLFFNGAQSLENGIFDRDAPEDMDLIIPFNHDLDAGPGGAEFRVHTSGTAPQRVCTIQFKGIREWTTSTPYQYDAMEFQVKLYESSNMIEFIYGNWIPSTNFSDFKTASCGLKGGGNKSHQLVIVRKGSAQSWDGAIFSDEKYPITDAFGFGNPPDRPKPDEGRTYRFISIPSPHGGDIVSNAPVCAGYNATLSLQNYVGRIQWQQSADGLNGWANIPGGNAPEYVTPPATGTLYYRAEISQSGFVPVYSPISQVEPQSPPPAPAQVFGANVVCVRETGVVYHVDPVVGATSYRWTLSSGLIGTSDDDSIYVDFISPVEENIVSVKALIGDCAGDVTTRIVLLFDEPALPQIVEVIQPNCIEALGTIHFSNLPTGFWTLVEVVNGTFQLDGGPEDYLLNDLDPGTYDFRVINDLGCISLSTGIIEILPVSDPPAPTVTLNGAVLHSDAPSGNQWYNQNGIIDGAIGQYYTAMEDGDYYAVVTLGGCISEQSNLVSVLNTATESVSYFSDLKVYPNPVSDELIIEISGDRESYTYEIINELGQIIAKSQFVEKKIISFSSIMPGIYLIKISDGINFDSWKIVKQ